jgi:dihydroorotate dehydrogenase (fumarate)
MPDLSTAYLGLNLKNPIVASPSPLCERIDHLRRMEDAGVAAIVLHSLFEEQIDAAAHTLDHHLSHTAESYAEALSYFPDLTEYKLGPEEYLEHLRHAKQALAIPVIASLNGVSAGGWTRYARYLQSAGADALELNLYFIAADPALSGADVENMYVDLVREVRAAVQIPLAVKIGPYFSAMANMARRLADAGADALVLFNRFYQPDIDLERLEVIPNLTLSTREELRLRLRWAAMLHGRIRADLAITGGVESAEDAVKCFMAGANVAMMTSAILRHGIPHFARVLHELDAWMTAHEYESITQMRGSMSQKNIREPAAFERANYMRVLSSYVAAPPP